VSEEANKALVRRYFDERWNQGNVEIVDELTTIEDPEGHKAWVRSVLAAFKESRLTMGEPVAEGDRVVLPWSVRGVLQRDYEGSGAPGETVEYSGLALLRVSDGKIVEDAAYTEGFGSILLGQTYKPG
jgi:predicted ester cyclase